MKEPDVWSKADLNVILGPLGAFVVERSDTRIEEALAALRQYKDNIWIIQQLVVNNVSSSLIRAFLKKNLSVSYLMPEKAIDYINQHGLFR